MLAKHLGTEDRVKFLGLIPNTRIVHLMQEADVVLIPSRHDYPEGLPMTIYEALCSRTPIVASDHPMFQGKLEDGIGAVVFPAGNPAALADSIEKLLSNPNLYRQLSENSAAVWEKLQIPVKSEDIYEHLLFKPASQQQWFYQYCLSSVVTT